MQTELSFAAVMQRTYAGNLDFGFAVQSLERSFVWIALVVVPGFALDFALVVRLVLDSGQAVVAVAVVVAAVVVLGSGSVVLEECV